MEKCRKGKVLTSEKIKEVTEKWESFEDDTLWDELLTACDVVGARGKGWKPDTPKPENRNPSYKPYIEN